MSSFYAILEWNLAKIYEGFPGKIFSIFGLIVEYLFHVFLPNYTISKMFHVD